MRTNPELFACTDNGYDKAQVDQYIQRLSEDYRNVMTKQSLPTIEMVVQALEHVEDKAAELINDIKNETMQKIEAFEKEIQKVHRENFRMITEINYLIQKLDEHQMLATERNNRIA